MRDVTVLAGVLTMALGAQGQNDPRYFASLASRGSVTMTRDNVELTEAGSFEFDSALLRAIPVPAQASPTNFDLRLSFGIAGGSPSRCDPSAAAPRALAAAVCERLMASARFALYRGFAQPIDRGFLQLQVFRSSRTDAPPLSIRLQPAYHDINLIYPPDTTIEAERISDFAGMLDAGLTSDVYPLTATEAGLSGRTEVLLGISSDGRVATCRPLQSAGSAVLDNTTCSVIVRRGRFRFAPTAMPYSGLRYRTKKVVWAMPE